MVRRLLDVNVLIALCDHAHPHHIAANRLFAESRDSGWASCPLTENGMIRILSGRTYPGGPKSAAVVVAMLSVLRRTNHRFVADDLSLTESTRFDCSKIQGPSQITDAYLLALAVKHRMRFTTFDGRINPAVVVVGAKAIEILPTP